MMFKRAVILIVLAAGLAACGVRGAPEAPPQFANNK